MAVTLVTGGVRSGKSRYAEYLLRDAPHVTVVATGAAPGVADPEWAARVARHREGRPADWETLETLELVSVLDRTGPAVLVDCLGTWVTGLLDRAGLWDDLPAAFSQVGAHRDALVDALGRTGRDVVLVTNEVGLGLLGDTPSGRFFQDELGRLNAAVADVANHVRLLVAGRVVDLDAAPAVPHRAG
ncbi:MAG: bifunctional adenosylcobinamide kinase/adenosylcobinamide-phosphate guanylyltransferase [Dermatophilaceae bacterium]